MQESHAQKKNPNGISLKINKQAWIIFAIRQIKLTYLGMWN